jgi:hypothetical protein
MRIEPNIPQYLPVPLNPKPTELKRPPRNTPAYDPPPPPDLRGHLVDKFV